jgi:hypothetical protein
MLTTSLYEYELFLYHTTQRKKIFAQTQSNPESECHSVLTRQNPSKKTRRGVGHLLIDQNPVTLPQLSIHPQPHRTLQTGESDPYTTPPPQSAHRVRH